MLALVTLPPENVSPSELFNRDEEIVMEKLRRRR